MKKNYEPAEMEFVVVDNNDVICTSSNPIPTDIPANDINSLGFGGTI